MRKTTFPLKCAWIISMVSAILLMDGGDSPASEIALQSGKTIEGEIVERKDGVVLIKDPDGIKMEIPEEIIKSIDGEMLRGVAVAQAPAPVESDPATPEIIIQSSHFGQVSAVVVNPANQDEILTGGQDGTLRKWNLKTGELIRVVPADSSWVDPIELSPDGKQFAVDGKGKIDIWDYDNLTRLKSITGSSIVGVMKFAPDGKRLVSGDYWNNLRMWDLDQDKLLAEYKVATGTFSSLLFDRTGEMLVVGHESYKYIEGSERPEVTGHISFIDMKTGGIVREFKGPENFGESIAYNSDCSTFATVYDGNNIILMDSKTGKRIAKFKGSFKQLYGDEVRGGINIILFTPNDKAIAAGGSNGIIKVWDISTGDLIKTFVSGSSEVITMVFSPDGKRLTATGYNGHIKTWDYDTGEAIFDVSSMISYINGLDFSPDGEVLAVAEMGTSGVYQWNLNSGEPAKEFKTLLGWMFWGFTFSPDGKDIAASLGEGSIRLYDVETGAVTKVLKGDPDHDRRPFLKYGRDGKTIFFASRNIGNYHSSDGFTGYIGSCNVETEKCEEHVKEEYKYYYSTDISPDEKTVASSADFTLTIRNLSDWKSVLTTKYEKRPQELIAFISDSELLSSSWDRVVKKWNVKTGESEVFMKLEEGAHSIDAIELMPDKNQIATTHGGEGVARIISLDNREVLHVLKGHTAFVSYIKYNPVKNILATAANDGTTKLWDADTGDLLITLIALTDRNWFVTTPSGYFDCSPGGKNMIRWRIGDRIYAPDQFFDKYYRPGLLAAVVAGEDIEAGGDIRMGFALPPEMKIVSPGDGSTVEGEGVTTIKMKAQDKGGGVKNLKIYVNGKIAARDMRDVGSTMEKEYTLNLAPGTNRIRAVAHSKDDTMSTPAEITVFYETDKMKDQELFIVDVGISQYKDPSMSLDYADSDAKAFADRLETGGSKLFAGIHRYEILNADATREKFSQTMEEVKTAAKPEDVVVVFMAGHGVTVEKNYYFIPHELIYNSSEDVVKNGIDQKTITEFLSTVAAQKTLLVLDTCESGGIVLAMKTRGVDRRFALEQLARSVGSFLISASSDTQAAMENSELKHGLLTQTLLNAMNGKADMPPADGAITVMELLPYIQIKVPEYAQERYGHSQYPQVLMYGMDFPLVLN